MASDDHDSDEMTGMRLSPIDLAKRGAWPHRLSRRQVRAGGAAIALPAREAFASPTPAASGPRNFVAVGTFLGWHQNAFLPETAGRDYDLPPPLTPIADFRNGFTVFYGLDHRAPNGHDASNNFFCGMNPGSWLIVVDRG